MPPQPAQIGVGSLELDRVRGEIVRDAGRDRAQPLGDREPERELLVVPGRPHRHRDRLAADPELERLLDGDDVPLVAAGHPVTRTREVVWAGASTAEASQLLRNTGADYKERMDAIDRDQARPAAPLVCLCGRPDRLALGRAPQRLAPARAPDHRLRPEEGDGVRDGRAGYEPEDDLDFL